MSVEEKRGPRVLVGGVPFGRDNVGDEAILECVVGIVREVSPNADIWVSTDDQEATSVKLNVKTKPLFGFDPPGYHREEMFATIDAMDAFVWSGATGLSDYPEIPLEMLSRAASRGKKTAIFCTGMNTELNPYLYKLLPGARLTVFSLLKRLSLGSLDLVKSYERGKQRKAGARMLEGIRSAGKVILRDAPSLEAMKALIGDPGRPIVIGADPAIEIRPKAVASSRFSPEIQAVVKEPCPKIGLCISAQSPVRQLKEVAASFDRLIADSGVKVVGIPMNPITDSKLMNDFRGLLAAPEAMSVAEGRFEPDEIAGLASEMDVVISSRLHLLILASITKTPIIGISRGSKVTNFTSQFDLPDIGSVDTLSVGLLENEIRRLLADEDQYRSNATKVMEAMSGRLAKAKDELASLIA